MTYARPHPAAQIVIRKSYFVSPQTYFFAGPATRSTNGASRVNLIVG
jgi:hypothetical protein